MTYRLPSSSPGRQESPPTLLELVLSLGLYEHVAKYAQTSRNIEIIIRERGEAVLPARRLPLIPREVSEIA